MSHSWADLPLGTGPAWPTDITDDGTPFEFSLAFDGRTPKFRILAESQEPPMTVRSSWDAGLRLNEELSASGRLRMEGFERIRDLFAPAPSNGARFALWHAAVVEDREPPAYKIYVNPQIHGAEAAGELVEGALARLDMRSAWDFLQAQGSGFATENLLYFSVDLSSELGSRIKIYVSHPGADAEQIERSLTRTGNFVPGETTQWIQKLLRARGPFAARPVLTCFAFTSAGAPPIATVHLPIRSYTRDDERGLEGLREYLTPADWSALRAALTMVAERPLHTGRGLLTYVSLRRTRTALSVTTYIAPEAFAVIPPRVSWPPARP